METFEIAPVGEERREGCGDWGKTLPACTFLIWWGTSSPLKVPVHFVFIMPDHFLEQTSVTDATSAMREALKSALQQRQNKVYSRDEVGSERETFRHELRSQLRAVARRYSQPVSDAEHFADIHEISDSLSARFGPILKDGRFRYGTAQKALNLYLKFLWRLGEIMPPPHCPVDGIVLSSAGIEGSWTHSDSEAEYASWIKILRQKARPLSLAEWEYRLWSTPDKRKSRGETCC